MEEINKLDENELSDLKSETQNDTDPREPIIEEPKPTEKFQVGEQLIEFKDLSIHFTNSTPRECCEMFMWLFQNLKNPPKSAPTYAQ